MVFNLSTIPELIQTKKSSKSSNENNIPIEYTGSGKILQTTISSLEKKTKSTETKYQYFVNKSTNCQKQQDEEIDDVIQSLSIPPEFEEVLSFNEVINTYERLTTDSNISKMSKPNQDRSDLIFNQRNERNIDVASDVTWTKGRFISDFLSLSNNLFVVSSVHSLTFDQRLDIYGERAPKGQVLVWNRKNLLTPLHIIHTPFEVNKMIQYNDKCLIFGYTNGLIGSLDIEDLNDLNSKRTTTSSVQSDGHSRGIIDFQIIPNKTINPFVHRRGLNIYNGSLSESSEGSSVLLSISIDGIISLWDLNNTLLTEPVGSVKLNLPMSWEDCGISSFKYLKDTMIIIGLDVGLCLIVDWVIGNRSNSLLYCLSEKAILPRDIPIQDQSSILTKLMKENVLTSIQNPILSWAELTSKLSSPPTLSDHMKYEMVIGIEILNIDKLIDDFYRGVNGLLIIIYTSHFQIITTPEWSVIFTSHYEHINGITSTFIYNNSLLIGRRHGVVEVYPIIDLICHGVKCVPIDQISLCSVPITLIRYVVDIGVVVGDDDGYTYLIKID